MAVSPVISGCGTIKLVWTNGTRTWLNVLGFKATGTFPVVDVAFANFIHGNVSSAMASSGLASHLAIPTQFTRIMVRSLNSPNAAEISSTSAVVPGTAAGDTLPLSVACCVTLRTALAGKSFRGRVYLSGFAEGENDATGRITAAANNSAAAFITALNSAMNGNGVPLAVLSKPRDQVVIPEKTRPANTGQGNIITAAIVRDTKWESQRRRTGRL